ncbi:hypothetical protein ASG22_04105 [Chryseobacterium sp. Leaf405]|uniref:hypothetical protein n=1 Tax=Chryseobacterium sp. Leaf405 TaxID=1736367 RepID=UPI0006F475AB|nr:hypothetical protein [Chryseobacterium sp. Leaf405]KQT25889.1 hypothetical protein ASG22_04105 [Chryseobacterium sp. Leaf405]
MEDKIICSINSMKKGMLDNDYTFYESGKIKHFYDKSQWNLNHEEWLTESEITESEKERLIIGCPEEFKDRIKKILYP